MTCRHKTRVALGDGDEWCSACGALRTGGEWNLPAGPWRTDNPSKPDRYLVTVTHVERALEARWDAAEGGWSRGPVLAWMPLPRAFKPRKGRKP
jgi:hypothetical protein